MQNDFTSDLPARLLDVEGKVLSEGLAYAPTDHSTVTFYPSDDVDEVTVLQPATMLEVGGSTITLTEGRRCPCAGRLHYHFERKS